MYISAKTPVPVTPRVEAANGVGPATWHLSGRQFSAVESELYPFDPKVVKAIRDEMYPDFVPIVIRSVFTSSTGGVQHFEHHGIGWALSIPKRKHKKRQILWPTNPGAINYGMSRTAYFLEDILRGPDMDDGRPGPFMPLNWGVYHGMKRAIKYIREAPSVEEEIRQITNREQEAEEREDRRLQAEVEYMIDSNSRQLKAALERDNTPEGAKTLGMARPHEPKPHVFVGGTGA